MPHEVTMEHLPLYSHGGSHISHTQAMDYYTMEADLDYGEDARTVTENAGFHVCFADCCQSTVLGQKTPVY